MPVRSARQKAAVSKPVPVVAQMRLCVSGCSSDAWTPVTTVLQEDKPAVRVNLKQTWLLKHAFGTVKADAEQKAAVQELQHTLKDLCVPVDLEMPAEAWD
eukprot:3130161-Alexandrium_andersonii.AAC.1